MAMLQTSILPATDFASYGWPADEFARFQAYIASTEPLWQATPSEAKAFVGLDDPLAGLAPWQIYHDCIWISDEGTITKLSLICIAQFMDKNLRASSMSYTQIAADCGFSEATAKRSVKATRGRWLRVEAGKGRYWPGKGNENLYHGIIPEKWAEELRRRKSKGTVSGDEGIDNAAESINAGLSGVAGRHRGVPQTLPGYPTDTLTPHNTLMKIDPLTPRGENEHGYNLDGECVSLDAAFDAFWQAFPQGRKQGKGKAGDVFRAITTGKNRKRRTTIQEMVDGARRYAATRPDPKYVPLPTTCLNQGRWADDVGKVNVAEAKAQAEFRIH